MLNAFSTGALLTYAGATTMLGVIFLQVNLMTFCLDNTIYFRAGSVRVVRN